MGTMLSAVRTGRIIRPVSILIYGLGGIGKSTFAAKAPNPIFLGAEEGTDHLNVARIPTPRSFEDVLAAVKELREDPHSYRTLIVDSLDWIEPLVFKHICRRYGKSSIELAAGGYGKGYVEAADEFMDFLYSINQLRDERGMNIIMIAHPEVKNVTNPQTQMTYQRYELKLDKRIKGKVMEGVDAVFFAGYEMFSQKVGDEIKPITTSNRVLQGVPNQHDGFDAKNRYGISSPVSMDLTWNKFLEVCNLTPEEDIEPMRIEVEAFIDKLQDEAVREKAYAYFLKAKDRRDALEGVRTRLIELLSKQQEGVSA